MSKSYGTIQLSEALYTSGKVVVHRTPAASDFFARAHGILGEGGFLNGESSQALTVCFALSLNQPFYYCPLANASFSNLSNFCCGHEGCERSIGFCQ